VGKSHWAKADEFPLMLSFHTHRAGLFSLRFDWAAVTCPLRKATSACVWLVVASPAGLFGQAGHAFGMVKT
jgi:hypothetical protein